MKTKNNIIYVDTLEELLHHNQLFSLSSRENKVRIMVEQLGFKTDIVEYLKEKNTGKDNPYHNLEHCYIVALNCVEGGVDLELGIKDIRNLFIAGLFHDFDHTANKEIADERNIRLALDGIDAFYKHIESSNDATLFSLPCVKKIIAITEYPYKKEPNSLTEKIIREADLMTYLEDDRDIFMKGLSKELGIDINLEQTINFMKAQNLYTHWGKSKINRFIKKRSDREMEQTINYKDYACCN